MPRAAAPTQPNHRPHAMPFSGSTSRKRPRSGSESAGARRRSASSQRRPRPSPPPTRSYADPGEVPQLPLAWAFAGAWARVQRMRKEAAADAIPLRLSEQFSTLRLRQRRETSGDARFNEVMRTLDQFADVHGAPLVRSPLQRNFHLHMANAAVAAIYGNDFDASQKRILEKYQWDDFRQEVMIITARGEGKTYAVAMFVASVLMRCPGITVSVFAVSMRASENVVRLVRAMLLSHPDGERMLQRQKSGKQSLQLLGAGGEGDIRVVTALPNSPDTTRGVHSDFMIVDEASFVDPALMMETIIPTTTKRRTWPRPSRRWLPCTTTSRVCGACSRTAATTERRARSPAASSGAGPGGCTSAPTATRRCARRTPSRAPASAPRKGAPRWGTRCASCAARGPAPHTSLNTRRSTLVGKLSCGARRARS